MKDRMTNASQQFVDFSSRIACWLWDTFDKLLDIILDFLARILELILAVMNLLFQVICYLRDICFESMRTFANVFRGFVNVVSNITCEEVEDFASACIVVLLWFAAARIFRNMFCRNSRSNVFGLFGQKKEANENNNTATEKIREGCCPCSRKRTSKRMNRRNEKRLRDLTMNELDE